MSKGRETAKFGERQMKLQAEMFSVVPDESGFGYITG
jgi:hypothetical protein